MQANSPIGLNNAEMTNNTVKKALFVLQFSSCVSCGYEINHINEYVNWYIHSTTEYVFSHEKCVSFLYKIK